MSAIAAAAGPQPDGAARGRGVVLVGGGAKYTPPAYACIAFLRRAGCRLPVEVWTPPHEQIAPGAAAELAALGNVSVRDLGAALPRAAHAALRQHKFLAKLLAPLLSGFAQLLLLDSDNLPLRDPSFLFEHPAFTASGLLMWPDFWPCQVKPRAWELLRVPPGPARFAGSHESGQLLLDKARPGCWAALLGAAWLNLRGADVHALLSDIGQGDKETLPMAWAALGLGRHGRVAHPVLALGEVLHGSGAFDGTAMLQRGPDGAPLFLHAHLPKVTVPADPARLRPPDGGAAPRKWQLLSGELGHALLPPGVAKADAGSYVALNAIAGFDIERAVLRLRQHMACRPAWRECCT
jgi:alpha 1,2-mannosyltransferase